MKITIKYCGQWNYLPKAASLADAIKKRFGVESTLIEGSGGVFDVHADGTQIWDKFEADRFPEHDEVLDEIQKLKGR